MEEKATAEVESATGTSRLAPVPLFGTIILYGTSYQFAEPRRSVGFEPSTIVGPANTNSSGVDQAEAVIVEAWW